MRILLNLDRWGFTGLHKFTLIFDPRWTPANMREFTGLIEARNIQIRTDLLIIDGELKDNIIPWESFKTRIKASVKL